MSTKFVCLDGDTEIFKVDSGGSITTTLNFVSSGTIQTSSTTGTTSFLTPTTITNTTNSLNSTTGALVISGGLSINGGMNATSNTVGGGLTVNGGCSISGDLYIGGSFIGGGGTTFSIINVTSSANATTSSSGALRVVGGIGVGGSSYFGGDITIIGTVDGRDISVDGSTLDNLTTTIGLSALTSVEVDQLENINSTLISTTQWGYLGVMDQLVGKNSNVTWGNISLRNNNTGGNITIFDTSHAIYGKTGYDNTQDVLDFYEYGTIRFYTGGVIGSQVNRLSISEVGVTSIYSTVDSMSVSTGALIMNGGVGIGKTLRVGGDTYIMGNLTVSGTQTSVSSESLSIADNIIVVNSGPGSSRDAGILTSRYQTENNSGLGDLVTDTPSFTDTIPSQTLATSTTIILSESASGVDDVYNESYILITSGTGLNQIRLINDYNGTSKTITVNTVWDTQPGSGATISILNRVNVGSFFDTSTRKYTISYTTSNVSSANIVLTKYTDIAVGSILLDSTSTDALLIRKENSGASVFKVDTTNTLVQVLSTTQSTTTSTGALLVSGGIGIVGNISVGGTVDSRDISVDGTTLDNLNASGLSALTTAEVDQLENIDNTIISTTQWGYLGMMDQSVSITSSVTFGNIATSGTVDGRDVSVDGSALDNLTTTIGLSALTSGEVDQLENINSTLISTTQWGYVGGLDQSLGTTSDIQFNKAIIDGTSTTALVVRKNGGGGDVFNIDTTNTRVNIGETIANQSTLLSLYGPHSTINGPHLTVTTTADIYPTFQQVNWTHDNMSLNFDCYYEGASFKSSLASSNFQIYKFDNKLLFRYGSNIQAGDEASFSTGWEMTNIGNISIPTSTSIGSTVNASSAIGGVLNIGGDQVMGVGKSIHFASGSLGVPTYTNRSVGTRLVMYPSITASEGDIAIGVMSGGMWCSVTDALKKFAWYGGTTEVMSLSGTGDLNILSSISVGSTVNASSAIGGALNVSGDQVMGKSIHFATGSLGAPTYTNRSIGTRLVIYPSINASQVDMGVGVMSGAMWFSVSDTSNEFKWYGETTEVMSLSGTGNLSIIGTVDGRDVSVDGSALDNLTTTIGLSALTSGEVDQLENINSTVISTTQWGYLGGLDQSLATTSDIEFNTARIDGTSVTALVVRKNGDTGDVCKVDTTNTSIKLGNGDGIQNSLLNLYGNSGSALVGPNILCTTTQDVYPVLQILNDSHNNISLNFDCWYDGANLKSGSIGSNFQIYKIGNELKFTYANSVSAGNTISSMGTGLKMSEIGNISIEKTTESTTVSNGALIISGGVGVVGNISVGGTVDSRDISVDGGALDNLTTTIGLSALTSVEVDQLENINSTVISTTQWGYLGVMDQSVATTSDVQFNTMTIDSTSTTALVVRKNGGGSTIFNIDTSSNIVSINTSIQSTTTSTGALLISGGLGVIKNITVGGTVNGRNIETDGSALDNLTTTIGLSALTSGEVDQLENINSTLISTTQWGYIGLMDQSVSTTSTVQFGILGVGVENTNYIASVSGSVTGNTGGQLYIVHPGNDGSGSGRESRIIIHSKSDGKSEIYLRNTRDSVEETVKMRSTVGDLELVDKSGVSQFKIFPTGTVTVGGDSTPTTDVLIDGTLECNNTTKITSTQVSTNNSTGALVLSGGLGIKATANSTSATNGGALTVAGGASISGNLYVGGNLVVSGTSTLITLIESVGSNTGTGVLTVTVSIGQTLSSTAYKVVVTPMSTTDNGNVYSTTVVAKTTSSFKVNIIRMDTLFAGWTDTNLELGIIISPP